MGFLCPLGNVQKVNNSPETPLKGRKPTIDIDQLKHLHSMGRVDSEIAKVLGVKKSTITKARGRLGLGPNRKINDEELRNLVREGLTDGQIAEVLGCDRSTVVRARNRNQIKANYLIGQHGAISVSNAAYFDKDIAWLEEQQRLHAVEMSHSSKVSSYDLLKWGCNGYSLGGKDNKKYVFTEESCIPADIPKVIRAEITVGISFNTNGKTGKGGLKKSVSIGKAYSGISRT